MQFIRKTHAHLTVAVTTAVQIASLSIDSSIYSINHSAIDLLARLPTATVLRRVFSPPPSPPETYSERLSRLLPVASELWRERPPPARVEDSRLEEGGPWLWSRSQSGV
jgi:hypothetical protein